VLAFQPFNLSTRFHSSTAVFRFKIDLQAGRKYRVEILMEQKVPNAGSSKVFKNGWSEDFLKVP
jgi:hypothetical protein